MSRALLGARASSRGREKLAWYADAAASQEGRESGSLLDPPANRMRGEPLLAEPAGETVKLQAEKCQGSEAGMNPRELHIRRR